MTNKVIYGEGKALVEVQYQTVGQDLQVLIMAGKAHVGAVALAVPCQTNAEGVTASVSVMTVPGHRDNIVAEAAALSLCKALGRPVSVTAGLHIDQASQKEIMALVDNAKEAIKILINNLKGDN